MQDLLHDCSTELRQFLNQNLAGRTDNWWQCYILDSLTFQQRRSLPEPHQPSLELLDFAALLRVFDQNWGELSSAVNLQREARSWLKETQSIRNRWAHQASIRPTPEDCYRDYDTLARLMRAIGADASLVHKLEELRQASLPAASVSIPHSPAHGKFAPGTIVRLKARSGITGAVIAHLPGDLEDRYQVFHDGAVVTCYASQLEPVAASPARTSVTPAALHAALAALQLRHPSTSHLYSLFASRINFVPYQFRPVLKLIQADRPRLLIADEVGVGKTIEAGLILKELQARRELRSVLVICPKPLVAERKWLEEMKRFDEQFVHLDGATLRYCIEETHLDGIWPQQFTRAILPYSLLEETLLMGQQQGRKKRYGLLDLDPPPAFDLVIVDEAHHIRNTDTWAYRCVRHFCDNAEAVVLLSATPIQLGDNDLFNLLHVLRPDVLPSRQAFEQMAEPNPHINTAIEVARAARPDWKTAARTAIETAASTIWGRGVLTTNPKLQQAYDYLNRGDDDAESRLALIRQLEDLYTFSPLINRTRRRDIGNFTTRKPETVAVEFTPEQAALHSGLIDLIGRILAHRHGDQNLKFMLTTVRRQVASCVFGLAPLLEAMLHRHLSQIELSEASDDEDKDADGIGDALCEFRVEVDALIRQARNLTGADPKFNAFLKVINDKQKLPNNKLLVFSTFRHTLAYLVERLADQSIRLGLIHGDISDDERRTLRHRFSLEKEDPQALDVLLSSEVGCEGLDFQFCDGLVNYDLPWNPMRVEQRIGRIDRYGQKSETVVIYNLITPGTVDAEIYERCLLRIGVFRQALGGSEEILGRLTREIHDIAENISLTPEEQAKRLQQLADNEIRVIQEQSQLEEAQSKFFGLSLPKRDEELLKQASSFWLAPAMLANLVGRYLESLSVANLPSSLGHTRVTTLQLGQETRDKLLADFLPLNLSGAIAQTWHRWLKGSDPYLALTFDAATAADRRDIAFITPNHPLARQAAQAIEPATPVISNLSVTVCDLPLGRHPYAIYRWRKLGIKEDFTFQPVCADPSVADRMLELLESSRSGESDPPITPDEEYDLEQTHHRLWSDARAEHIEQISYVSQTRLASLDATHTARISLLEEQRNNATDARIRRMREAQIETAKRDYERRARELREATEQGDIIAEAVVFGTITVVREAE